MSTEAKREGNRRHAEKLIPITFRIHQDGSDGISKAQIKAAAEAARQSMNAWILDAIRDKL